MKRPRHQQRLPQIRTRRVYTIVVFILVIVAIYIFWKRGGKSNKLFSKYGMNNYAFNNIDNNAALKTIHRRKNRTFRLKGAPPKVSYYEQLFPLISALGATGLLIEYEDMFPYSGTLLQNLSALNAYSRNDIRTINKLAKKYGLHVTPLVQTFGHLEFVLKLRGFRHLREVPEYPQTICPTHSETLDVVVDMLEQVIEMHPESRMIHIGADEVYFLGNQ